MFRRIDDAETPVAFDFEGERVSAKPGETVAAALIAAQRRVFRATPVTGAPRGPFCMMGTCFDCLIEVDGMPNRQACMTEVRDGMSVRRQSGPAGQVAS